MSNKIHKQNRVKMSKGDRGFYFIINTLLAMLVIICGYPLVYVISASFSSGAAITSGQVILWPVDFTLEGYTTILEYKEVMTGYANSIFYTVVGTSINIVITILAAYPLSRTTLKGRGFIMFLFTFTMLFNGGMIPNYILMNDLQLIDTRWAMLLPGAIAVYNMIIARTFFQNNIPKEVLEAAQIDGCNDVIFLTRIVLPLSQAIIAVLVMFYAVGHWNSYFNAFLYINSEELVPLQIVLRDILISNTIDTSMTIDPELMVAKQGLADLLKYSLMVFSSIPIIILYPFTQKYFVQGVMIGSVKG